VIDVKALAETIRVKAGNMPRFMVAIGGAPASGKSTLAADLCAALKAMGETAVVVPMDGFHFDDIVLNQRGHRPRKGAPFTFDVAGFEVLLKRIRAREPDIAIPVFDRTMELSRNAADIIDGQTSFILIEGNYLLLDKAPWRHLRPLFDLTIYLDVPEAELERRLVKRWLDHGFDMTYAVNWIASNDMPNIREVQANVAKPDMEISP
jgi:pantothenate kinase